MFAIDGILVTVLAVGPLFLRFPWLCRDVTPENIVVEGG